MKKSIIILAAAVCQSAIFNPQSVMLHAQPGSLDTSFSNDGIQITAIGSSNDYGRSVRQQADGKLVVAGYTT